MSSNLLPWIRIAPVFLCVFVGLAYVVYKAFKKEKHTLDSMFVVGVSASGLPAGIMLIYAVFIDITIIQNNSEMYVYVALGGMGLGYVSIKAVIDKFVN